jgi:hypothetical protein
MHTGRPTTQCQRQRYPYHASASGIMARAMVVAHCSSNGKLGVSAHLLLQYSTMGEHQGGSHVVLEKLHLPNNRGGKSAQLKKRENGWEEQDKFNDFFSSLRSTISLRWTLSFPPLCCDPTIFVASF